MNDILCSFNPSDNQILIDRALKSVNHHKQIGIDSYGASITTMDEIFLKVTHQDEVEQESENSLRFGLRNSTLR